MDMIFRKIYYDQMLDTKSLGMLRWNGIIEPNPLCIAVKSMGLISIWFTTFFNRINIYMYGGDFSF